MSNPDCRSYANLLFIGEIKLRVIECRDVTFFSELARDRGAQTPAASNDDDFHSSVAALYERRIIFRGHPLFVPRSRDYSAINRPPLQTISTRAFEQWFPHDDCQCTIEWFRRGLFEFMARLHFNSRSANEESIA